MAFRLALALLALLLVPGAGRAAECTAVPVNQDQTVVSCPGSVNVLRTDPNGLTTGSIHGQLFVGRSFGPGNATGTLNGRPYDIQAGIAPDPSGPPAFKPPPPTILAQPSPADDWRPPPLPAPPAPW